MFCYVSHFGKPSQLTNICLFFLHQVIRSGLKKVEKEYNDLPQYANLLLSDPKLTDDDRKKIQDDLDSYKIRHDDLLILVREREKA